MVGWYCFFLRQCRYCVAKYSLFDPWTYPAAPSDVVSVSTEFHLSCSGRFRGGYATDGVSNSPYVPIDLHLLPPTTVVSTAACRAPRRHGHRQHAPKNRRRVVSELCKRTDRQTDGQQSVECRVERAAGAMCWLVNTVTCHATDHHTRSIHYWHPGYLTPSPPCTNGPHTSWYIHRLATWD